MNKTELITAIAESADISKKDSEKALKAFVDVVTEELKKGEKVLPTHLTRHKKHCARYKYRY